VKLRVRIFPDHLRHRLPADSRVVVQKSPGSTIAEIGAVLARTLEWEFKAPFHVSHDVHSDVWSARTDGDVRQLPGPLSPGATDDPFSIRGPKGWGHSAPR
jgi:hypothetical protein